MISWRRRRQRRQQRLRRQLSRRALWRGQRQRWLQGQRRQSCPSFWRTTGPGGGAAEFKWQPGPETPASARTKAAPAGAVAAAFSGARSGAGFCGEPHRRAAAGRQRRDTLPGSQWAVHLHAACAIQDPASIRIVMAAIRQQIPSRYLESAPAQALFCSMPEASTTSRVTLQI